MNALIEFNSKNLFEIKYNNYTCPSNENFSIILNGSDNIQLKGKLLFFLASLNINIFDNKNLTYLNELKIDLFDIMNYFANNELTLDSYKKNFFTINFVKN